MCSTAILTHSLQLGEPINKTAAVYILEYEVHLCMTLSANKLHCASRNIIIIVYLNLWQ